MVGRFVSYISDWRVIGNFYITVENAESDEDIDYYAGNDDHEEAGSDDTAFYHDHEEAGSDTAFYHDHHILLHDKCFGVDSP